LDEESNLPDGQQVTIVIQPVGEPRLLPPGEGILRSAGGWSDDPAGLDEFLSWNRQQRKIGRQEIPS
jgi:hypothetical protein